MSGVIIGMPEAVEAAKKAGLGNMQISAPLVIEMADYIAGLENQLKVKTTSLLHEVSGNQHLANVIKSMTDIQRFRYTTDKDRAELIAAEQREQLDQFAMAALSQLINHRHLTCIDAAAAAYNYAQAMQAESQKRQGDDV